MIIVDAQKLKFLLAGRILTVEVAREYRKGRDYAVGKSFRRGATCRARIESCERLGAKTWRIQIRQHNETKPVWLAKANARQDYTTDPSKAMLDEPEPMSPPARYLKLVGDRDDAERRRRASEARRARRAS